MTVQTTKLIENSIIYQIFTGRWESANILDHKGKVFDKLKTLPFENLKKFGVDTIYLLGIFDNRGPIIVEHEEGIDLSTKENRYPSPFAISNHKSLNPDLGTIEDFEKLVTHLHKEGLRVIVDFVPNHTGTAHPWTKDHQDYYIANESFVREFSGDVYKLNYQNKQLRSEMTNILKTIQSWGVDGVRCDMAHLIPLDFWKEAIAEMKSIKKDFIFIAEAYSDNPLSLKVAENHIEVGFDVVYHQALFENLKKVYEQGKPERFLEDHISYILSREDINSNLLSYISNHDDPIPKDIGEDRHDLMGKIINLPGPTLMCNGMIGGHVGRLAHHFIDNLPDEFNEVLYIKKQFEGGIMLGIDIGGTKISSAIVDEDGNIIEKNRAELTQKKESEQIINIIAEQINYFLKKGYKFEGVGISLPGFANEKGDVLFAGGTLGSLVGINIPNALKDRISTNLIIKIENDANCFALAEAVFGAGENNEVVLGVIWGTGVGLGIVINKNTIRGEAAAAGEFGHIVIAPDIKSKESCGCGQMGCLEMLASGKNIERRYKELGGVIQDATVQKIYKSDEKIAKKVISDSIHYLGLGISYLVNIINPGVVVIGGGVSLLPDEIYGRIKSEVDRHALKLLTKDLKIVRHQISDDAGIIGAAALIMNKQKII